MSAFLALLDPSAHLLHLLERTPAGICISVLHRNEGKAKIVAAAIVAWTTAALHDVAGASAHGKTGFPKQRLSGLDVGSNLFDDLLAILHDFIHAHFLVASSSSSACS